ncbi:FAD-binding oxidoreductase [Candidatus Parcubacteria bacterium]|jgi:hypothetical protein|nr:MAG: FAD-binding oxidoreductase [Candidatus Parcubacteria bacterium]
MTEIESQHDFKLARLRKQVRWFFDNQKQAWIYHGATNSTRQIKFEKDRLVDVSDFNRILEINPTEKFAVMEPNVPMDKLVSETLKFSLLPPVVPEFPGITIGGAIQGGAEESSSFRHSLVHDCALEYELVLGNGEVIKASREIQSDLFWGLAASYGSLGILTKIKLKLIPAKNFVRLAYQPVKSFNEAIEVITQKTKAPVDFIDGIMFSKNSGVIMTGIFSETADLPAVAFHRSADEWFYLHAKKICTAKVQHEELVPVRDYLFRYDRGAFWMGWHGFKLLKLPFNRLTRFLLNGICKTRTLYRLLHETNLAQRYFVQDFNLPRQKTQQFLELTDRELGIFPLWFCPLRPGQADKLSANCLDTDLVFNIGVWGKAQTDTINFVEVNKKFEKYTAELNGRKMLYAHQYYNEKEFWKIYDLRWYKDLRAKYHASQTFPDIYEKTRVIKKYQPSILIGIWQVIKSPFKLRIFK